MEPEQEYDERFNQNYSSNKDGSINDASKLKYSKVVARKR